MNFECIVGYFSASDPKYVHISSPPASFGLLREGEDRWTHLKESLKEIRAQAVAEHPEAQVKLILLGRHGEGYHNLKAAQVGEKLFLEKWGRETTDGHITWGPDPALTHLGEEQARHVASMLEKEREAGMPLPTSFYSSPLQRACKTLQLAYASVPAAEKPLVLENLREGINLWHQREWPLGSLEGTNPDLKVVFSDTARSTKSTIKERFPTFEFEQGFPEEDPLWSTHHEEPTESLVDRARKVFHHVFTNDSAEVVALSAHGGTCLAVQRLLDLPLQLPHVAAILPLIIKAVPAKP